MCKQRKTMAELINEFPSEPDRVRKAVENLHQSGRLVNVAPPRPGLKRAREAVYLCEEFVDLGKLKEQALETLQTRPSRVVGNRMQALGWQIGIDLASAWGIKGPAR